MMHEHYMRMALQQALQAFQEDEVPVGAIIVRDDQVLASAYNQKKALNDPTAHAEMIAITQAAEAVGDWRLERCTMYVTLEPCPMCAGALVLARIHTVVFGATDAKAGAVESLFHMLGDDRLNHQAQVIPNVYSGESFKATSHFWYYEMNYSY